MGKIVSIDCETNGLYGDAFAVAAIVRQDGVTVAEFSARCPIDGPVNQWVADNVLPALAGMPTTHESPREMRDAFWTFWLAHKDGSVCIAHMGVPVESKFFRQCIEDDPDARQWSGPYPLHDVATALLMVGADPSSVDGYNREHGIVVPFSGVSHHPMYDAAAAAVAWEHAISFANGSAW